MKKDYMRFISILCALVVLLCAGFMINSKKVSFEAQDKTGDIDIKSTTWEIVQYSDGPQVENLVGTDWVIHFDKTDGFIRLCDTHFFSYGIAGTTLSVRLGEQKESSCQESTVSSETVFLDLLAAGPIIERVSYKTKEFNEVLTLVSGNKKIVMIPRLDVALGGTNKQTTAALNSLGMFQKPIAVTADVKCNSAANSNCQDGVFEGNFLFTIIDEVPGESASQEPKTTKAPITVRTSSLGLATATVPVGTYQVTLDTTGKPGYKLNPIIFSVVDSQKGTYELALHVIQP